MDGKDTRKRRVFEKKKHCAISIPPDLKECHTKKSITPGRNHTH